MAPEPNAAGPGRHARLFVVMTALLLLGLPLLVVGQMLRDRVQGPVTRGAQPGGELLGRVVDAHGEPVAGVAVELYLRGAKRPDVVVLQVPTDADGRYRLHAPAGQGYYELRTGGGAWMYARREASFLDAQGETVEPPAFDFVLRPGSSLVVELRRADGLPVDGGEVLLDGRWSSSGSFSFLSDRPFSETYAFEGARIELAGLPPLRGRARITLRSGKVLELPLDLAPGEVMRSSFEL
jgi:5-hydroxyisourate hydrolase-like protein (transthyretin family)